MSCAGGARRAGGRLADEDVARHLGRNRDVEERQDGRCEIGKAAVRRQGSDVTLVGCSYMTLECLRAADVLARHGIEGLVVDDASTDGTAEFVEAYASVRLLRHELCRGAAGGAQYSGRDGTRQGSAVHRRRYPR